MDNTILVHLDFKVLHLNKERADMTDSDMILHSDSLYASIFHAWNLMGLESYIPKKDGNPEIGFVLSSLFPYMNDEKNEPVYFFPRPNFAFARKDNIEDTTVRKKIKKAVWVDKSIFNKILKGEKIDSQNFKGPFWSGNKIHKDSAIESQIVPRSKVSRSGKEETDIFYIERYYFNKAGLFFLLKCDTDEIKNRVIAALKLLGDEGIGTDRNVGNGKFEVRVGSKFETTINPGKYIVNLGMYCPANEQELKSITADDRLGYDIAKRGGWLSEPYLGLRKKYIYMFKEGSCFLRPRSADNTFPIIMGAMHNIAPDEPKMSHPVWRCGKTMFLPF